MARDGAEAQRSTSSDRRPAALAAAQPFTHSTEDLLELPDCKALRMHAEPPQLVFGVPLQLPVLRPIHLKQIDDFGVARELIHMGGIAVRMS